jgi:hypothetical protein
MGNFLFTTASRTDLGPSQPPIQWVPRIKRLRRGADHLLPSSVEVKWVELYPHSPNTPPRRGAQLIKKHSDNFTFTFSFTFPITNHGQLHYLASHKTLSQEDVWSSENTPPRILVLSPSGSGQFQASWCEIWGFHDCDVSSRGLGLWRRVILW